MLAAGLGLLCGFAPAPTHSQDPIEDERRCWDAAEEFAPEVRIASCTAMIGSGQVSAEGLPSMIAMRGYSYAELGDYEHAIADYSEAIRLGGDSPELAGWHRERSRASYALSRTSLESALTDAFEAIRLQPGDAEAYALRADLFFEQSRWAYAISDLSRALTLGEGSPYAWAWHEMRVRAYANQDDRGRALEDYAAFRAIELGEGDVEAQYARAFLAFDLEQYENAAADWTTMLQTSPEDPTALNQRCRTLALWNQQLEQALTDCDLAMQQTDPGIAQVGSLESRGLIYLRMGNWTEAMNSFAAAIDIEPMNALPVYGRGIARIRLDQREQGQADLAAAEEFYPGVALMFAGWGIRP